MVQFIQEDSSTLPTLATNVGTGRQTRSRVSLSENWLFCRGLFFVSSHDGNTRLFPKETSKLYSTIGWL